MTTLVEIRYKRVPGRIGNLKYTFHYQNSMEMGTLDQVTDLLSHPGL
jgi:hypothetical protein